MAGQEMWTLGIEEEYQIVDPQTRELRSRSGVLLPRAEPVLGEDVQPELHQAQIETASSVVSSLSDLRAEIVRLRRGLVETAAEAGSRIGAAGTHPFSRWSEQPITPKPRYREIAHTYQHLAEELVIFGCHVHVGLDDPAGVVAVLNRVRPWLAPLLALAANSPFWEGEDTGYASYRTQLWSRWPTAGPPGIFASRDEYDALLAALIAIGSIEDATKIYWDVRLSEHFPTIEFRVTDVCMTIDEAVMIAGLVRALARTCYDQAQRDDALPDVRQEVLRAAHWHAARYGLEGTLVDTIGQREVPAPKAIEALLAFLRPALEAAGDWDEISSLVGTTLAHGNGAQRQRVAYGRRGRFEDVVDLILSETRRGLD